MEFSFPLALQSHKGDPKLLQCCSNILKYLCTKPEYAKRLASAGCVKACIASLKACPEEGPLIPSLKLVERISSLYPELAVGDGGLEELTTLLVDIKKKKVSLFREREKKCTHSCFTRS